MKPTLLVVGAQPHSLGWAVSSMARGSGNFDVATAGVTRVEDFYLNLVDRNEGEIDRLMRQIGPDHIVCTAGINHPREAYMTPEMWMSEHLMVNVLGPMRLLDSFLRIRGGEGDQSDLKHFVAISSNSAAIPRTASLPYCASKAALSMAIRCAARDESSRPRQRAVIYGYEPGLLTNTPMTGEVRERLGEDVPLTRMRGEFVSGGLSPHNVAGHIVRSLVHGGAELNGCLVRLDAGEV